MKGVFMNIDIRKYVVDNFKETNLDDIEKAIEESIEKKEEVTLPGLGVFMEILWKQSTKEEKNNMLQVIRKGLES
jgi:small acid-soluble spore protein I (minor)